MQEKIIIYMPMMIDSYMYIKLMHMHQSQIFINVLFLL